jgi:predicted NBD/HSP70 family sugar kinase
VAEVVDARGRVLARGQAAVTRPARLRQVASALRVVCMEVAGQAPSPVRLAMVSAADPVDRASGRLVRLPDAPFLLGELSPAEVLAEAVRGPVVVDNDVNWAARAELEAAGQAWADVFYLYLGEGLGGAVISDGDVRRGRSGIAGEVAHVITVGPDGTAMRFLDVFGALGLRHPGSTAIDIAALDRAIGDAASGARCSRRWPGRSAESCRASSRSATRSSWCWAAPGAAGPRSSTRCARPPSGSDSRSRCAPRS